MENASLRDRVAALEARLDAAAETRTPVAVEPLATPARAAAVAERLTAGEGVTPEFVESVGTALAEIEARKEADREAKRKELQAQRIEERVAKLELELGLNNRQASEMRTVLTRQDDQREALFATVRDGNGDPRDMRDKFRTIRDDTYTALEGFLSQAQLDGYKKSEESEFRRDFGGGGPPRGPDEQRRRDG